MAMSANSGSHYCPVIHTDFFSIFTGDTEIPEEAVRADIHVKPHISSCRRTVLQACNLQHLFLIHIKSCAVIPDHSLYMAPLVQGDGIYPILIVCDSKTAEI